MDWVLMHAFLTEDVLDQNQIENEWEIYNNKSSNLILTCDGKDFFGGENNNFYIVKNSTI